MKTKTPRFKETVIAGIALFVFLAALCVPAFLAGRSRNLLFALPKNIGSSGVDVFDAQEFSKNEFPLTYEISYSERVSLSYAEFQVNLIGTGSSYPQIIGLSMEDGSFFSGNAWTGKLKHAVLNEKAAFNIFGNSNITGNRFRIRGETWLVTGVIKDGYKDNSRIYIPSSVHGGRAAALAINISDSLDETFVKNSLKNIGIREWDFDFINLNNQIRLLCERIAVLTLGFGGFLCLSLFGTFIFKFQKSWKAFKKELDFSYLTELFKHNKRLIIENIYPALGLVILSVLALVFFINTVSICLPWQDIPFISRYYLIFFYPHLERVYTFEFVSRILFFTAIAIMGFFFFNFNIVISNRLNEKTP